MKSTFFFYLLILLVFSSIVSAHSYIAPGKYEFKFVPGFEKDLVFRVGGTGDYDYKIISGIGDLKLIKVENKGKDKLIYVKLKLPDEISTPGKIKVASVSSEQVLNSVEGFGSKTKVISPIYVIVPFNGIYLKSSFSVDNVNINDKIPLEVKIHNLGSKTAEDVNIEVNIYHVDNSSTPNKDHLEKVRSVVYGNKLVEAGESYVFSKLIDSLSGGPGEYKAECIIKYSNNTDTLDDYFNVGYLNVDIINRSDILISGKINPIFLTVENKWNGVQKKVYGSIFFNGKEYKTAPVDLDALARSNLTGFIDLRDVKPGTYDAKLNIYYGSNTKSLSYNIIVKSPESNSLLIIILVIIVVVIFILFIFNSKNKPIEDKKSKVKYKKTKRQKSK